ncbi:MAG: DUF58 domain-containing protein [Bacteroidota bacterium]|nr:DUF58 domain-containing protein [Bacteroidota bacterium]
MSTSELLKKVRKIEIKTRGLSNHIFSGEYHTAFKGRGMAFSEVREYQPGDDIRAIDWNVTARYNSPFVKIFEEEREMTVMLIVDVSGSGNFGTNIQFKRELATELSAILAFSAIHNNDKVGVIFFTSKVEKFIPPKKGKTHILHIIRELLAFQPSSKKTNIDHALEYFNNVIKKRSVVFILSDFVGSEFKKELKIANRKHDVVAIHIHDKREQNISNLGIVALEDAESEKIIYVDTSSKKVRNHFFTTQKNIQERLKQVFKSTGSDYINISTGQDYVKILINFFRNRTKRK